MILRLAFLSLATMALILFVGVPANGADKEKDAKDSTHEGKVVKVEAHKLTMIGKGKEENHTHEVGKDAKITIDGKEAKLSDLKEGQNIRVSMHGNAIVKIEVLSKDK